MTLSALQFPLYGFPQEVRSVLAVFQNGVDAVKRSLRKTGRRLFMVDLRASSGHGLTIDDITNYYKPSIYRYHLLRLPEFLISSNHQPR